MNCTPAIRMGSTSQPSIITKGIWGADCTFLAFCSLTLTLPDKTLVCLGPLQFDCVCNVDVYTMAFTARVVEESASAVISHVLHDRGKAVQCADLHVCA